MLSSAEPLSTRYDVALLDLDGVVYLGHEAIPGVPAALAGAREDGMRLAFVTNNASRTPQQVVDLLVSLDVPAAPAEVITSSHAAAHYLADRLPPGAAVLVLGTTGLIEALSERGLRPVFSADDDPAAVVQGYSPSLDWKALAEGMVAIRHGALWVATNLDPTVPSPRGPLPGNGSLVAALRHASGHEPVATGKPDPTMHTESVQRSRASNPIVVGDRLDTDIEGARRSACDSLLVFTGVTEPAELLTAGPLHRPDYLGTDVGALRRSHPEITTDGSTFRCGPASVSLQGPVLRARLGTGGSGHDDGHDGLDLLRALVVAGWHAVDEGRSPHVEADDDRAAEAVSRWRLG